MGRGIAVGDLDNDGWPDVVISNTNSPAVILRNVAAADNPARWLGIKLSGKKDRDIAGSTVVLTGSTRHPDALRQGRRQLPVGKRSPHPLRPGDERAGQARDREMGVGRRANLGQPGARKLLGVREGEPAAKRR